jgi:hypothetical protein
MRKGTSPTFWKKYEAMQIAMAASCMPRTAISSATRPMQIQRPQAVCLQPRFTN